MILRLGFRSHPATPAANATVAPMNAFITPRRVRSPTGEKSSLCVGRAACLSSRMVASLWYLFLRYWLMAPCFTDDRPYS